MERQNSQTVQREIDEAGGLFVLAGRVHHEVSGLSARVENDIHVRKEPFGGYRTDLDDGCEAAMHIPYGRCADWPGVKAWSVDLMKQHLLATVYEDPNLMDTSNTSH
jgi:hypothetical protein